MDKQDKIAVLIDAENVSKKYIKLIMDEVSDYGIATYKRIYGDFTNPSYGMAGCAQRFCTDAGISV